MTGVLIKEGNLDTDGHVGKMSYEDEDRDQGDSSTNQGTPKIASELPEALGEPWNRFFLTASEGADRHLAFRLPSFHNCEKRNICCVSH